MNNIDYLYVQSPDGDPEIKASKEDWDAIKDSLIKETSAPVIWMGTFRNKKEGIESPFAIVSRSSDDFLKNVFGLFDGPAIYYDENGRLSIDGAPRQRLADLEDAFGAGSDAFVLYGKKIDSRLLEETDKRYPMFSTAKGRESAFDKIKMFGARGARAEICQLGGMSGFVKVFCEGKIGSKDLDIHRRAKGNDGPDEGGMQR